MAEFVKVAVDAMGGDNAPAEIIKGAVDAVNESDHVKVFLVGQEDVVNRHLADYTYNKEQIEVVNATEVIETAEPPVMAIRRKKDSSIVKAMYMVKDGTCDAYVSAGSTGATLVGGQVIVGRIKGQDGFCLHGTCDENQESQSCHCKYRCRRGKGKCACKRNFPAFEKLP